MSETARWLGLDIGGANLKAATCDGFAKQTAFPLWKRPTELAAAIASLSGQSPPHDALAVTMTGELADCYATKAAGVSAIVAAVEEAAAGRPARYYSIQGPGEFLPADDAVAAWPSVAASNWHALATGVAELTGSAGLLIDVGSTTTDLVPFAKGRPESTATNDTDRLIAGELLYQGVGRTPLCAVVDSAPYRKQDCPVAAELFATTADVALLLGHAAPNDQAETADGRPLTEPFSIARFARMICADTSQFDRQDALKVAQHVCAEMERKLASTIERVLAKAKIDSPLLILSGGGAWLAQSALMRIGRFSEVTPLAELIGEPASLCAPAWAVATLAGAGDQR